MAAYAAVISLKRTIQRLLNSSRISIVSSSRELLEFAYYEATSLQRVLQRLDDSSSRRSSSSSERLNALDGKIREAVHKLEDSLEFHESNQFFSDSDSPGDEEVRQEIRSFAETVKIMEEEYIKELDNPLAEEEEDDEDAAVSTSIDFGVKMVGLSDEFFDMKNQVLTVSRPNEFGVLSFIGVPGSRRTIIAKRVFEDLHNGQEQYFDCGAWVTIGPEYQFKEILVSIISQVDDRAGDNELLISEGDEKTAERYLHTSLKGRRYMIVLDDICDTQVFNCLRKSFPCQDNGSLILLTSRLMEVAILARSFYVYETQALPEEVLWDILRVLTFDEESCPPDFEEAGRKIARNCQGSLIALAKVMLVLWKAEKTPEYWNRLAADKENSIFRVADEIAEICKIKEDLEQLSILFLDVKKDLTTEPATDAVDLSGLTPEALIGFAIHAEFIKTKLFPKRLFHKMEVISFFGMAGIGKTIFVKEIFYDSLISHHFKHRAWVTVGPKYQSKEILVDILAQIYPDIDKKHMKGDAKLTQNLCDELSTKRCLIVLDDVWDEKPLHYLGKLFPDIKGKALVTTRLAKFAQFGKFDYVHEMRLLNKEESWRLFCQKVFAEELCPPELEKDGKRISENCEGLPLVILTVANLLSKAEKTPEYWKKVAEKQNSVFVDAQNEISKTLLLSYKSLPQCLKVCFLYMGAFPQNYNIPRSKLIHLWIAEGFIEPEPSQSVEDFAVECLLELVNRSLVMVQEKSSNFESKACSLHSVFWHLSNNEAAKNMFFHAFNGHADNPREDIKNHRRMCVHNSIILGIKDVYNLMASISSACSLLCAGRRHQYPVPVYLYLRLLRVLDAATIRFYEFPIEVLKLIHLRYLALTCNGKLPASISKLWNLQFLIVSRHLRVNSFGDSSYLPIEIWDMKELKHLQITGSNLPNPNRGAILPNLLTLLDVSAHSCRKRILKKIPNLKKLGIRIELAPNDNGNNPFRCLNRISLLHRLESLKCIVVNPELSRVVVPPAPRSMFPSGLKKLSLSGLGYPWEYMSIIGKLQNLEVLKLRCYAFQGPKWETGNEDFPKVKFLLIEDTDLVHWRRSIISFPVLKRLNIKHCYKLEELPYSLPLYIEMIEVVDSNPLVVTWAKQMEEKNFNNPRRTDSFLAAHVHSSWNAGKPQVKTSSWTQKVISKLVKQEENLKYLKLPL